MLCSLFPEFAMSPNNNEVHIYSKKGGKWEVESVLTEVCANILYQRGFYYYPSLSLSSPYSMVRE